VPVNLRDWKLVLLTVDITDRKRAEEALRESEQRYSLIFDKSAVPAALLKLPEVVIVDVNQALERLVGYTKAEMLGKTVAELGIASPQERNQSIEKFSKEGPHSGSERRILTKSGEERIIVANTNALTLRGQPFALSTMQDITARKRAEKEIIRINTELEETVIQRTSELAAANEQLHQLAILDELTGLYNRRGFLLLAEEQLLLAKRNRQNLIVFYGDLDRLKQINDEQGHAAGDQAIVTAAQILSTTFRASDIKARLGGDEFIILAIQCSQPDTSSLLTRLHENLAEQKLTMSVGVTLFDFREDIALSDLISRADEAMYEVKTGKPRRQRS
jgi:diguanylate cyclase (GGDEF)-like protein/PAS domain S-box-containing protein